MSHWFANGPIDRRPRDHSMSREGGWRVPQIVSSGHFALRKLILTFIFDIYQQTGGSKHQDRIRDLENDNDVSMCW